MEGEEQGGKHISLGESSADESYVGYDFLLPPLLLSACQDVWEPMTDGSWHGEQSVLGVEDF